MSADRNSDLNKDPASNHVGASLHPQRRRTALPLLILCPSPQLLHRHLSRLRPTDLLVCQSKLHFDIEMTFKWHTGHNAVSTHTHTHTHLSLWTGNGELWEWRQTHVELLVPAALLLAERMWGERSWCVNHYRKSIFSCTIPQPSGLHSFKLVWDDLCLCNLLPSLPSCDLAHV